MPFDPKLIHPDEPPVNGAGDLELPDDLSALAEQLTDDAAHLAASYPAELVPAELVPAVSQAAAVARPAIQSPARRGLRSRTGVALLTAAVAAGLAISLSVPLAVSQWPASSAGNPSVATAPPAAPEAEAPPAAPNQGDEPVPIKSAAPRSQTVLSLTELSGPELEALLDLQPVSASVSF
ncbi:MAG: hypothetical protein SFU86_06335 [Pirellulaceae bacterium]|nr:hypothetical protein [Pirellulaceae bacterium]